MKNKRGTIILSFNFTNQILKSKRSTRAPSSKFINQQILNSKRSFEFSFSWLFSVLVGAIILFLAIYAAINFIETGEHQTNTVTAKQLSLYFEPLETNLESGKFVTINLDEDAKIYNNCYDSGSFGMQRLSVSTKNFKGAWNKPGGDIPIKNKYLFSSSTEEGKQLYLISLPFTLPWKISDITIFSSKKYCFINAPEEIRDEVEILNSPIEFENCTGLRVCFDYGDNCDIIVEGMCINCENKYEKGVVRKGNKKMYYVGNLLYAAIFSSKDIYDCNVKRLMARLVKQAGIYSEEASSLSYKCGTLPETGFLQLIQAARNSEEENLFLVYDIARELEEKNQAVECNLW